MSEPERSEHGAITESPTLLPGHGAAVTSEVAEAEPRAEPAGPESNDVTSNDVAPNDVAPNDVAPNAAA